MLREALRCKCGHALGMGEKMADNIEICLGNNGHTLFSDEPWYLVIPPLPASPFLEGRFQTDAPDRTPWPTWTATEYCVLREDDKAICRFPLTPIPSTGEQNRFASIVDQIWNQCVRECEKLSLTDQH